MKLYKPLRMVDLTPYRPSDATPFQENNTPQRQKALEKVTERIQREMAQMECGFEAKKIPVKVVVPIVVPEEKLCSICGEVKNAWEFRPRKDRVCGLTSACRKCENRRKSEKYRRTRKVKK